jgi:outer membrane biosynthesis protein TonB
MAITLNDCRRSTACRPLLLLIISLLLAPAWAFGQTNALDYFHRGAQYYIFGDKTNAAKSIYTGLRMYPTNQQLEAVAKLLQKKEQQDQNQSKNNKQQQDQQKQKQDQKNQQQKKQDQKSEQQKKDEEKAKQEQAKKDKEKQQQQEQADKSEQKNQQDEKGEGTAAEAHMSPQEARALLDQLKDDAKVLLFTPTNKPIDTQRGKFKDW